MAWLAFTRPEQQRHAAPRRAPLFAALSFGASPRAALKPRVEPKTGLEFPELFCSRGKDGCAELQGVGVRAKRIAGLKDVNVYALGIYVEEAALDRAVKPKHKGKAAAALAKDAALFSGAVWARFGRGYAPVLRAAWLCARGSFLTAHARLQTWSLLTWRSRCALCSRAASRPTPWRTRWRSGWSPRRGAARSSNVRS